MRLCVMACALLCSPVFAAGNARQAYDIPAGSLGNALDDFVASARTPVLFDRDLVRHKSSPAVKGNYTDQEAVRRLLKGTGLSFRVTDKGVILIMAEPRNEAVVPAKAARPEAEEKAEALVIDEPIPEIIITGFRGSLDKALSAKRRSIGTIDTIVAEDLSRFPNTNLADAMQRIPSVTLIVGDGGVGRNITVRGLGPMFSRVRINGMAAASQTGASDKFGPNANARNFDFNVFSSDIFSALMVSKSAASHIDEGSLGATVDLKVPKAFDFEGDRFFSLTLRGSRNRLSETTDPRLSALYMQKSDDRRFGVLASLALQEGHTREVGYSAADILSAGLAGNGVGSGAAVQPFCTPIGYGVLSPDPVGDADKGASATMCATGNPRTGSLDAYETIMGLRSPQAPDVPASGAFFPRLPRYLNSTQSEQRVAGTLSLQFNPREGSLFGFDLIYNRYRNLRQDNYIEAISFARSLTSNGQPMMSVREVEFTPDGSLLYGVFDGVDIRSESLTDKFSTTVTQASVDFSHRFSPQFEVSGLLGMSRTVYDNPMRLQLFMDAIDTSNFVIDFKRNNRGVPVLGFGGIDVNDASAFSYGPPRSDGTVLGGFSAQGKPLTNRSLIRTMTFEGLWSPLPSVSLRMGYKYSEESFTSHYVNLVPWQRAVTIAISPEDLTTPVSGLDRLWGHGAPQSWVAPDPAKWRRIVNMDAFEYCGRECGVMDGAVDEITSATFGMLEFDLKHALPVPVRGNMGVRYFQTRQISVGYTPVTQPAGSLYPIAGVASRVARDYDAFLPAVNLVFDLSPDVLMRVSASKVISRPDLYALMPYAEINAVPRTGSINSAYLDPIRANTFDASLEWYFSGNSIVSIGFFHKRISSYIQRVNSDIPFSELGLPASLLEHTHAVPEDIFRIARLINTPGGPLSGIELNLKAELDFLPGRWRHMGVLANYTHVQSRIDYVLSSDRGKTVTATADLIGLSRHSSSMTVYYEDHALSFRLAGTYKGRYIRRIPSAAGSDIQGNAPSFYLDASAAYAVSPRVKFFVEAQNLTDEHNRQYIDSVRQDTVFDTRSGRTLSVGVMVRY